ncbi:MAG TPA: GNAT family N-acetyltransferase [Streptosporangiaceae bacterium]|nr:GNAT family N-acetyltransferase [Streptosporangiaceae bacterium]
MRSSALFSELDANGFRDVLDQLIAVYAAAMRPEPGQLIGRRAIMERHAGYPDFRGLVVSAERGGPVIAFTYGFRGAAGQWWHDVVAAGISAAWGSQFAAAWLRNALEIAEVHVHPDQQGHGIGRNMLPMLTAGRREGTAVLSTRDADTPARRLYRGLGFSDLLTGYGFPGDSPPYAVMGAVLPLRDSPRSPVPDSDTPPWPTPPSGS